jgi:hypothetical protein
MVERTLNNQSNSGYIIKHISVSCPECACMFAAPSLAELPPVTEYDTIEADLHRVLPDAELRGALIAVCPHCSYANWTVRFKHSSLNPEMLPDAAEVPNTKKFALAVKFARDKGVSPLDIAFIALNGLYCARESGEESDLWLELAAYEQSRGMAEESFIPPTGQDHLIMAELWRQLGSFENAYAEYERAKEDDFIPRELLRNQMLLCAQGNTSPIALPPYMVRELYPEAAEAAERVSTDNNGRRVPPFIRRAPKSEKLETVNFGPPERLMPVSEEDYAMPEGFNEPESVEIPLSEPVPAMPAPQVAAAGNAPAGFTPQGNEPSVTSDKPSADHVPVAKVRQIIAQPSGASAIYLVQAAQVPQLDAPNSGNANGRKRRKTDKKRPGQPDDPLPRIDMPTNEYFDGASSPNGGKPQKDVSPTQKALNRAMRQKEEEQGDRFPEIQLTDEYQDDSYGTYADYSYMQEAVEEEDQQQQQPAASTQQPAASDTQSAIAQVESFLNLTRQPSYQSWIRSYRR